MLRKHLVIVGGGWAGLALVRELKHIDPKEIRITIISDEPNFRYSPGLYRVATGYREHEAIIPIAEVLEDLDHVDFVLDSARTIDKQKRTITTASGKRFHYDYAVLALGMVTSYFGIPGIEENSFNIKTTTGVQRFRAHLHQEITTDSKLDKNYVVVGAGPTGVELAAALASYLKRMAKWHGLHRSHVSIDLVDAATRVVPNASEKVSQKITSRLKRLGIHVMVNSKVESESPTILRVNGKSIPTHTVVWTAGVSNNPFYTANKSQFIFSEKGKIVVNDHLMIDEHTYVIGDNAATTYSGLAITAVHNAKFVGRDLKNKLTKHTALKAYKPLKPAAVLPVGRNWAILDYNWITISGYPASLLRAFADFIGYMDILGFWKALEVWTRTGEQEERCKICKAHLSQKT